MSKQDQHRKIPGASANLVAQGYQLHEKGKLSKAEGLYRQSLANDPDHADTNNVFGLLCIQTGRFDDAVKLIRKAPVSQPDNSQSHYNLAIALKELDQLEDAEKHFRQSSELAPGNFQALNSIGALLRSKGELEEAIQILKAALKFNPYYAEAHCNLGMVYQTMGDKKRARSSFARTIEINPHMVEAHIGLAELAIDHNQLEDASVAIRQALIESPESSAAHNILGIVLNKKGKTEKAIASFKRAIDANPSNAEALINLGITLEQSGQLDEAADTYQQAIRAKPGFTKAHYMLAHLKNHVSSQNEIQAAELLFNDKDGTTEHKIEAAFALACAYESIQQYEHSFQFLEQGHRLKKKNLSFNLEHESRNFEALAESFNTDLFERRTHSQISDKRTIFIVGMPRSGTSLTEQILASHPQVHGAGELNLIAITSRKIARQTGQPFPQACHHIGSESLDKLALNYLEELETKAAGAEVTTDTNPMNFLNIGLISLLLPNALIINCVRQPMDNCLSIYKHLLSDAHTYSHDLEDLGAYFKLYQGLMRHWHELLPGKIYDLPYEKLVSDSEGEIRKLLNFCALPFDENCLHFQNTSRMVRTPSASQVRQPLYSDTIDLWKHYEQQLRPLQAILETN